MADPNHVAPLKFGRIVAAGTGTTAGSANGAALVNHGAVDRAGGAYTAADLVVLALPTSNAGGLYQNAAPTATQIDIRSTGTSVPYLWVLFHKGS